MKKYTAAAAWVIVIGFVFYIGLLFAFGYQTWELVDWLFPSQNLWMKIATVFSFDVMAVFWSALDMFYEYQKTATKHLANGMWFISFILATAASIIQMYIGAVGRDGVQVSIDLVHFAYALVIISLTVQIIAFTACIRMEWAAHQGGTSVRTQGPRPMGPPPARAALAQQGETKTPLTKPEPKEEA